MPLKIVSWREGVATNSSSNHSLIFSNRKMSDKLLVDYGYGWSKFVLASAIEKEKYYFSQAIGSIFSSLNFESIKDLKNQLKKLSAAQKVYSDIGKVKIYNKEEYSKLFKEIYRAFPNVTDEDFKNIDHQSQLKLPIGLDESYISSVRFFKQIVDPIINNPKVVVYGGNDNEDPKHKKSYTKFESDESAILHLMSIQGLPYPIREEAYGYVLFFTINEGVKVRLADGDNWIEKLDRYQPELVDVSITDYCDKECSYCYHGASKEGKNCNIYSTSIISPYIKWNSNGEYIEKFIPPFEVVIGGGDPVSHPQLLSTIEGIKRQYIHTNHLSELTFSPSIGITIKEPWKISPQVIDILEREVEAVGISIASVDEFKKAFTFSQNHLWDHIIKYHYIPGITPTFSQDIEDMVNHAKEVGPIPHFLFLGQKYIGRGSSFEFHEVSPDEILSTVQKYKDQAKFSIDTALANTLKDFFPKYGIKRDEYDIHEGIYSKYFDLTNLKFGFSSYSSEMFDCNGFHAGVPIEIYSKIPKKLE